MFDRPRYRCVIFGTPSSVAAATRRAFARPASLPAGMVALVAGRCYQTAVQLRDRHLFGYDVLFLQETIAPALRSFLVVPWPGLPAGGRHRTLGLSGHPWHSSWRAEFPLSRITEPRTTALAKVERLVAFRCATAWRERKPGCARTKTSPSRLPHGVCQRTGGGTRALDFSSWPREVERPPFLLQGSQVDADTRFLDGLADLDQVVIDQLPELRRAGFRRHERQLGELGFQGRGFDRFSDFAIQTVRDVCG